jgi:chromosome segregation ATPase
METNNNKNTPKPVHNQQNKGKKFVVAGTIAIAALLLAGGIYYYYSNVHKVKENQIVEMAEANNQLETKIQERDSLINEWVTTFNEIEKDLNLIKDKEQLLEVKSDDKEFSEDKKAEILKDIKFINSLLESNKVKISSLNAKLRNSGIRIAGLESKISDLESSIALRDSSINTLKNALHEKDFKVAQLNEKMNDMELQINQKNSVIDMQTNEMLKAYLAYGTYKELKEKGVLTKDGGFLWIGQEKTLQENFSEENFKEINILETKTIPVNSKKAELITEHPSDSYNFVKDSAEMISYLEIKDPGKFWKISKYAVLETNE